MMGTNATVEKDMMLKLKDSFSLKSFSSKRYHSSLVCNSKTIRMDVNLIDGKVLTSSTFSGSNFVVRSFGNVSKNNEEASNRHEEKWENLQVKNESTETSRARRTSPKRKNKKELSKSGDSLKSTKKDGKLKSSVNHSSQPRNHESSNQMQTKDAPNISEYESFRCDVCMKYFSSKRNVKRHSILHNSERHPCETCGKVFNTKENLKRHYRAMHEVEVKSVNCSKCYKAFSRKSGLNRHLKNNPDHV